MSVIILVEYVSCYVPFVNVYLKLLTLMMQVMGDVSFRNGRLIISITTLA
ncbi:hypothetical protein MNBD_GAMMA09-2389 [hydrothermal vent metagenome]|uniref:Uncharacterized protein n=1 Tax=hydrothermal vent metagenome TaxID=652676 RepID=A0A3B0XTI6_9ZZZZ